MALKDGAFTGSAKNGNPYGMKLNGVDYDINNLSVKIVDNSKHPSIITYNYESNASRLVEYLSLNSDDPKKVIEIGPGTGITTLELLKKYPNVNVMGIESSEGMLDVAKYKFNLYDGDLSVFKSVDNEELQDYWNKFREESEKYKGRATFILDDIQTTDKIDENSTDAAVANQVMHWTDLSKTFSRLRRFLKDDSPVIWNTASHFFEDSAYPSLEYGFRYSHFVRDVLGEVGKKVEVDDYKTLSRPKHDINSIQKISKEQGFDTRQVDTYLLPMNFQNIIGHQIYAFVKALTKENVGEENLDRIIKKAIQKTIISPDALSDTKHSYEIIPIFESTLKDTD
ncbi:class I SAM-dependent methyltransferase [archaeon]|nr:class I SAM-dependent methyltransferase [Nanoarchaeota archaeon]MBU4451382.1 class I SAM-dependent methyltransferase [Nanoarchaeota archaeon]MCG2724064.1 class I SAM-dependent methyltransferase [archaeon]